MGKTIGKIVVTIAVLCAGAAAGSFIVSYLARGPEAATARIARGDISEPIEGTGIVTGKDTVTVRAKSMITVYATLCAKDDDVQKGDPLIAISSEGCKFCRRRAVHS